MKNDKKPPGFFYEAGSPVNAFTTTLYMIYVCSFFLHLAERIPGIRILRPDLLLIIIITIMLLAQNEEIKGRLDNTVARTLMGLIAYIILSLPFVEWPGSILRNNASVFIKGIVFFLFTIFTIDTDKKLKRFVSLIIACQLFRVLEPLYLHIFYGYWGSFAYLGHGEFANRLSGAPLDIINPNGLAFVVATAYAFIHYLWLSGTWKVRTLYLIMCIPLFMVLFLTLSRSGFVAMMVIVWNIFIKSSRKILFIVTVVISATVIWNMMDEIQRDRYYSLTGSEASMSHNTFQGRINAMKKDFYVALQRPVFGFGLGTSREAKGYAASGDQISHILYAEVLIELGIIGFIMFIIFIYQAYRTMKRAALCLNKFAGLQNMIVGVQDGLFYEINLMKALITCFWMYLIFSIAQYGLSEYHWYLLAGLATVMNAHITNNYKIDLVNS